MIQGKSINGKKLKLRAPWMAFFRKENILTRSWGKISALTDFAERKRKAFAGRGSSINSYHPRWETGDVLHDQGQTSSDPCRNVGLNYGRLWIWAIALLLFLMQWGIFIFVIYLPLFIWIFNVFFSHWPLLSLNLAFCWLLSY